MIIYKLNFLSFFFELCLLVFFREGRERRVRGPFRGHSRPVPALKYQWPAPLPERVVGLQKTWPLGPVVRVPEQFHELVPSESILPPVLDELPLPGQGQVRPRGPVTAARDRRGVVLAQERLQERHVEQEEHPRPWVVAHTPVPRQQEPQQQSLVVPPRPGQQGPAPQEVELQEVNRRFPHKERQPPVRPAVPELSEVVHSDRTGKEPLLVRTLRDHRPAGWRRRGREETSDPVLVERLEGLEVVLRPVTTAPHHVEDE